MPHDAVIAPLERWMIPALVDMSSELMAASSYTQPFNAEHVTSLAEMSLSHPTFQVWMAWRKPDDRLRACGMIVGSIHGMLFSTHKMAVEETVYVRPKTPMRAAIANSLMQTLIHWAFTTHSAAFLRGGETSKMEPRAVDAFMRRNGLHKSGTLYQLENVR